MSEKFTIRQHRMLREISQEEMANKLNISYNTYRNWEEEPAKISIKKAMEIADIFKVSINDIFFSQ